MSDWAKETAAAVRGDLKAAQNRGDLDPRWNISVRKETASLMQAVRVTVTNAHRDDMIQGGEWTDQARRLAATIRRLTADYARQADSRHRFFDVHFDSCTAPD